MERTVKGIWIPIEIWEDTRLTALDKIILAEIDSLDGEEHCFASNKYIAQFCHCSETHVSKSISKLIEYGYISIISFDGRTRCLKCNFGFAVGAGTLAKEQDCLNTQTRQTCQNDKAELSEEQDAFYNIYYNNKFDKIDDKIAYVSSPSNSQHSSKYSIEFETFWNAYPRHTNTSKKETYNRFCKALTKTDLQTILHAIECQKKTKQWIDGYIPMPTTWLNKEKWNDEVEEYTGSTKLPTKTYTEDQTPWKAANWLSKKLNKMHPSIQPASQETLQMWASVFDKMETEDKHPPEEILALMRFAFQDNFWNKNISTPMDLKKNYVKILAKAESEGWFN